MHMNTESAIEKMKLMTKWTFYVFIDSKLRILSKAKLILNYIWKYNPTKWKWITIKKKSSCFFGSSCFFTSIGTRWFAQFVGSCYEHDRRRFYRSETSGGILKQLYARLQIILCPKKMTFLTTKYLSGQLPLLSPQEVAKDLLSLCVRKVMYQNMKCFCAKKSRE